MRLLSFLVTFLISLSPFCQVRPDVVLTTGHNDQVNVMEVSDNGRFLASASNDKQIKIWEIVSTMEFRTISGTSGRVEELAFSPNNRYLAGKSSSQELIVWDVITGEEIYTGVASTARGLEFEATGDLLYYINEDYLLTVLNTVTWNKRIISDVYTAELIVDVEKDIAYCVGYKGGLKEVRLSDGKVLAEVKLFDEYNYPFCASELTADGKYIAFGFSDDIFRLYDTKTRKFHYESKNLQDKIKCLTTDLIEPIAYLSLHGGEVIVYNYEQNKVISKGRIGYSPFSPQAIKAHPNGEIIILAHNDLITFYDFERKLIFKELKSRVGRIFNMAYDPTGKYLAIATDKLELQIWDLTLNRVERTIPAFFPCEFTPDGKNIVAMTSTINLGMFDVETGKKVKSFDTDYELIQSLAISRDGQHLAGAGFQNRVKVWEISTTNRIAAMTGHFGGILALDFHPLKPWIVSGSIDETARVWDFKQGKEIKQFTDQTISIHDVAFSPDGTQLATASWDKTIKLRNTADWSLEKTLSGHVNIVNSIAYNGSGDVLISGGGNNTVGEADNGVICWDTKSGFPLCKFKEHRGEVLKVLADPVSNRFYSASVEGAVKLFDYSSCDLVATYQAIDKKEFMIYTPDNYYIASRNALNGIAFRINGKLVPLEQFDIHLNRPDIVATRIGKSSNQLIKAYNYLYKKRLRKLNLDEGSLKIDFKLPTIKNETKFDLITTAEFQTIWVTAEDDDYNLTRIDVYVNNVPIFGQNGLKLPGNTKQEKREIQIPLVRGKNEIVISCHNSNGVESLNERFEIIRDSDLKKHDLYIATIGVSKYLDESFSLKYPTADAVDVLTKFQESAALYRSVKPRILLDDQVTIENVLDLKNFFAACTHEDFAIIFIAGHGVLNVDYDYFFGTYDMDFNAPEKRGLPYDKLSELLSNIKAYQKLLIMDTCHSGELDKEEIERAPEQEKEDGDIKFRGVEGIRVKEGIGTANVQRVTEDLFSDLRRGSGATVISSAGGTEFAIESDEWSNGLFTYALIQGLDIISEDSTVYLSEIRAYVNKTVSEMSNGRQIPTAREENIVRDYIIFGK